jgi:hypothetical protein
MSHGEAETCKFGHILEVFEDGGEGKLKRKVKNGKISDVHELENDEDAALTDLLKEWRRLKTVAGSQGDAYKSIFLAVDELDEKDYTVKKYEESMHVSPQSQMHSQFMERKQQAEQNIKQSMQGYQQLIKDKHMLEHDIRKLRSRVEAINSRDETVLKGDFIELVDGAGQSPRQGGDQMSIKAYRDQSIYPSIVADFNEMDSVGDLKTAEQKAEEGEGDSSDYDDGPLADVPANEKAILKKKYKMYEQWKDLYGSEVSRKLNELKGELKRIERSLEETKEWLEPYVRDAAMINKMGDNQKLHNEYGVPRGNSTAVRIQKFIAYKGLKKDEAGELVFEEENPTHYRATVIKTLHLNLAGFSQPQTPAEGVSLAKVFWYPCFTCKHVFEDFFEKKINEHNEMVEEVMQDYVGGFQPNKDAEKLKKARQEAEMSVRDLRKKVEEELDEKVPLELSSQIRRVEDGLDPIEDAIDDKYLEKIEEILDDELEDGFTEEQKKEDKMFTGFQKKRKKLFGYDDTFYMKDPDKGLDNFTTDLRFDYYWDLKIKQGMYTVKG